MISINSKNNIFKILYVYAVIQCFVTLNESILGLISNFLGLVICVYVGWKVYDANKTYKQCSFLFIISLYFIIQYIYIFSQGILQFDSLFQGIKILTLIYLIVYLRIYSLQRDKVLNYFLFVNKCIYSSIILCFIIYRRFAYKPYYGGNEIFGFISSPHSIGLGLIAITIYIFYRSIISKEINGKYGIYGMINIIIIIMLNVRTYQVALFIGIIFLILMNKEKQFIWKFTIISIAIVCLGGLFILNSKFNFIELRDLNEGGDGKETMQSISSGRTAFWGDYFEYIVSQEKEFVIFGRGLSTTPIIMGELGWNHGAHNDFLQILGEYGVLGILAYLTCIVYLVLSMRKREDFICNITIVIAWLVSAFINGSIYYTFSMILMIVSINCKDTEYFGEKMDDKVSEKND